MGKETTAEVKLTEVFEKLNTLGQVYPTSQHHMIHGVSLSDLQKGANQALLSHSPHW